MVMLLNYVKLSGQLQGRKGIWLITSSCSVNAH